LHSRLDKPHGSTPKKREEHRFHLQQKKSKNQLDPTETKMNFEGKKKEKSFSYSLNGSKSEQMSRVAVHASNYFKNINNLVLKGESISKKIPYRVMALLSKRTPSAVVNTGVVAKGPPTAYPTQKK